jgi:D-3-phosphoglycerate dehydrogenase
MASLDELLPLSAVLSLHLPLTPATRNLIGAPQLAALPEKAILVNTARGPLVDEAALVEALRSGRLFGAGLDTLAVEPLPAGSPLRGLPNVVMTPHVGGSTPAALEAMATEAVRNVLGFLEGRPPSTSRCMNPQVL